MSDRAMIGVRVGTMLDRLERYLAAHRGKPCPTNNEIADAMDLPDAHAASKLVSELSYRGRIAVHLVKGGLRRIEAGDGSWATLNASRVLKGGKRDRASGRNRLCLKCRDEFTPTHRFNFCCASCAASNAREAA